MAQIDTPATAFVLELRARREADRMMRAGQAIEHVNRQGA